MRYGIILGIIAAFALAACGTLNPNISAASVTGVGIGGKANPDGTAEAWLGYGQADVQFIPAVGPDGKAITFTGHCGEQEQPSALIITNTGATGGAGATGLNNAFSAGVVVAGGPAAKQVSQATQIQASRGVTVAGAVNANVQSIAAPPGMFPSSPFDQVGQNGVTACAH